VARLDGVEYKIEWSANNEKITFTRGEDKFVTVHVPNDNLDEIKYVLTGTISDAEGKTITVEGSQTQWIYGIEPPTPPDGCYPRIADHTITLA
jgi:hypothetical protein